MLIHYLADKVGHHSKISAFLYSLSGESMAKKMSNSLTSSALVLEFLSPYTFT